MLTTDTLVEGVHFLPDDPPGLIARKLLRVNLSDLAAKAAEPFGYLLAVAWPGGWDEARRAAFAAGLAEDGALYGLSLLGGDTVSTPGPMTASVTLLGYAPAGRAVRRSGARPGDLLHVTGTIGDGWLGLQAAQGGLPELDERLRTALAHRYRLPQPRLEHRSWLLEHASAAMDVSDGLIGDLAHLCRASGVGAVIDLERLPLSEGARAWLALQPDPTAGLIALATGGDDYELLLAASEGDGDGRATPVGRVVDAEGVRVLAHGVEQPVARGGWRHG